MYFMMPGFFNSSQIASGIMYNSWDAHYRQINVLKFTYDGAALISGSEDSGASVWSMSRSIIPVFRSTFIAYHSRQAARR
jgi:hypothetical protein